jgi:hypothetical protein
MYSKCNIIKILGYDKMHSKQGVHHKVKLIMMKNTCDHIKREVEIGYYQHL